MSSAFIQLDKPFYFAGDTIEGQVYLFLTQPINGHQIILKFKGWESVRWIEERVLLDHERQNIQPELIWNNDYKVQMDSSDSEDVHQDESMKCNYVRRGQQIIELKRYKGSKMIARFKQPLYNFGGSFIPPGQYSFPFRFKTGQEYPASFMDKQSTNHAKGRIKYEMQAFIRGSTNKLRVIKAKTEIIVREIAPIKNEQQQMEAHVTSCCCCDQGTTRIRCFFQKNGYAPGEDAKIYCVLDNREGKSVVQRVTVSLKNEITYISAQKHTKHYSYHLFEKSFSGMQPGQQGERQQVVKIQNGQSKHNPLDIKPTSSKGMHLKSTYYLKVQAVLSANCTCCSELPVVRQPILIYPWSPVNNIFQAPSNWNPEVMQTMNFKVNIQASNNNIGNMSNPYG